jgi:hypothetical protein
VIRVSLSKKRGLLQPRFFVGNHSFKCQPSDEISLTCAVILQLPGKYSLELQENLNFPILCRLNGTFLLENGL